MLTAFVRKGLILAVGLGFGMGLMAGAAVLATRSSRLTDIAIIGRARALGMVLTTELPAPVAQAPVAPTPQPAPAKVLMLTVQPGMSLSAIADALKQGGAIVDAAAFVARAEERGAAKRLMVGVFEITLPATPDQIIDRLTTTP